MAGTKGRSGRKSNELPFRHALLEKLDGIDPLTDRKRMFGIAEKLIELAEEGDIQAIREVMDRVDGKAKQVTELSGPDGDAIPHSLTVRFE